MDLRVGVIQSNYIPWRGYFDFIRSVDLFILHDDLQYTKQDWRNRNRIKSPQGIRWLTVPIRGDQGASVLIQDAKIAQDGKWTRQHCNLLVEYYRKAPFFDNYFQRFENILNRGHETLSSLNYDLIVWLCGELHIKTPIQFSNQYKLTGTKTERLIELMKKVGATAYLTGPSAKDYIDESQFKKHGIELEYKTYNYPSYPQLYGAFEPFVSILDLLFNCGPKASEYLIEISSSNSDGKVK